MKRHADDNGFVPLGAQSADLPLFQEAAPSTPMVRRTDPESSVEAAADVLPNLSELQARVYAAFVELGPMTARQAEELPRFATCGFSTIRKRISELEAMGRLEVCGKADRMRRFRAKSAHEGAA